MREVSALEKKCKENRNHTLLNWIYKVLTVLTIAFALDCNAILRFQFGYCTSTRMSKFSNILIFLQLVIYFKFTYLAPVISSECSKIDDNSRNQTFPTTNPDSETVKPTLESVKRAKRQDDDDRMPEEDTDIITDQDLDERTAAITIPTVDVIGI